MSVMRTGLFGCGVCALVALTMSGVGVAEPLNPPPGPVAATGPTQIFELPFVINQPGSYIVQRDLTGVAGQVGITISTSGVTLDLNGFTLFGVVGSGDGVFTSSFYENVVIRNGAVFGWGGDGMNVAIDIGRIEGITASKNGRFGISNAIGSFTTRIKKCEAYNNLNGGIRASANADVSDCFAYSNGGEGIHVAGSSQVAGCVSTNNTGAGISAGTDSSVTDCVASANSLDGLILGINVIAKDCNSSSNGGFGIFGSQGVSVIDCVVNSNTSNGVSLGQGASVVGTLARGNLASGVVVGADSSIINTTAQGNTARGISLQAGSTVVHCTSTRNGGDGIWDNIGSLIKDCAVTANGGSGVNIRTWTSVIGCVIQGNGLSDPLNSAGILGRASGTNTRIEGNNLSGNTANILYIGTRQRDLIVKNKMGPGASTIINISIPATGVSAPISTDPATAGPWDNFDLPL